MGAAHGQISNQELTWQFVARWWSKTGSGSQTKIHWKLRA
jgi:hypothetical protein